MGAGAGRNRRTRAALAPPPSLPGQEAILEYISGLLQLGSSKWTFDDAVRFSGYNKEVVRMIMTNLLHAGKLREYYDILCPETKQVFDRVDKAEARDLIDTSTPIACDLCGEHRHHLDEDSFRICYGPGTGYIPGETLYLGPNPEPGRVLGLRPLSF